MENKQLNLEILSKQFRKKGAALRGFKNLKSLINSENEDEIKNLLRHHKENAIESDVEINSRDDIDFLIDYYSILEIALIAGYIQNPLPRNIQDEIVFILSNKYMNKYFSEYYSLLLPQIILKQVLKGNEIYFKESSSIEKSALFEQFLIVRQRIKEDKDIDQFLWFLDDGWTMGYSISNVWKILGNEEIIRYKLGRNNHHPLNKALLGFIKYTEFLAEYASLLKRCEDYPLLQSAIWNHQAYWFKNMKMKLGDMVDIGINNIKTTILGTDPNDFIDNKNSFINSTESVNELKHSIFQLDSIADDITYVQNEKFGEQLAIMNDFL